MFEWLAELAVPAVGLLLFTAMIAAAFAGYALRARAARTSPGGEAAAGGTSGQEDFVVSAVLSLLALLLGFTFALVADRYEGRRQLVIEDASAIETAYLQTQLLEEPHRSRIGGLLIRYIDNRVVTATADTGEQPALAAVNNRLIVDLWAATAAAFESIRDTDFSSAYLQAINNVIEKDAARKEARSARIPPAVFAVLLVYMIVAAGALGYVLTARRGRIVSGALLGLFTLMLLLMLDMNRPVGGTVQESQLPMERLRDAMRSQPPAVFDRWKATRAGPQP